MSVPATPRRAGALHGIHEKRHEADAGPRLQADCRNQRRERRWGARSASAQHQPNATNPPSPTFFTHQVPGKRVALQGEGAFELLASDRPRWISGKLRMPLPRKFPSSQAGLW